MFRRLKKLKVLVLMFMACFLLSGNMAFADLAPYSLDTQHEMSQDIVAQIHCLSDPSGSSHVKECSSDHCPQCFSLLLIIGVDVQLILPSIPDITLIVSWLPNIHLPELRPPILFDYNVVLFIDA